MEPVASGNEQAFGVIGQPVQRAKNRMPSAVVPVRDLGRPCNQAGQTLDTSLAIVECQQTRGGVRYGAFAAVPWPSRRRPTAQRR